MLASKCSAHWNYEKKKKKKKTAQGALIVVNQTWKKENKPVAFH